MHFLAFNILSCLLPPSVLSTEPHHRRPLSLPLKTSAMLVAFLLLEHPQTFSLLWAFEQSSSELERLPSHSAPLRGGELFPLALSQLKCHPSHAYWLSISEQGKVCLVSPKSSTLPGTQYHTLSSSSGKLSGLFLVISPISFYYSLEFVSPILRYMSP